MLEQKRQLLKEKVKTFPKHSGCYLMVNEQNEIIYVGKAKNLQKRLLSYFKPDHESLKVKALVENIIDVEFILTSNEVESLVLENNLIKKYRPKYNIRLRDDKTYPYIQWNTEDPYPRIEYTRRIKRNKTYAHIGPFPEGFSIKGTLLKLIKLLKLRDCSSMEFSKRSTPCLLYQMQQCMAPCVRICTMEEYQKNFNLLIEFYQDPRSDSQLVSLILNQMTKLADEEEFEKAMHWRSVYSELIEYRKKFEEQRVENLSVDDNIDFLGYHLSNEECDISIYSVRHGRLIGTQHFFWLNDNENNENEVGQIISQLISFYEKSFDLPEKIITPWDKKNASILEMALQKIVLKRGIKVLTRNKLFSSLLVQAADHANEVFRMRSEQQKETLPLLKDLQNFLRLNHLPRVIECFDIAIWQGRSPTASQVVFVDGRPSKKDYRYYHLEQREELNNDFAMMKEVLERRIKKGHFPDIIVIDGGKAQLNIALGVFKSVMKPPLIIALAKEKGEKNERIFFPGESQSQDLNKAKGYAKLLMHLRDEAHRFSRKLHHHEERKRLLGF